MNSIDPYRDPLFTSADLRATEETLLAMQLGGASVRVISAATGIPEKYVRTYIDNALKARRDNEVRDQHAKSEAQLDALRSHLESGMRVISEALADPDTRPRDRASLLRHWREYIGEARQLESDRRKLLGLDAPQRVDMDLNITDPIDTDLQSLLAEMDSLPPKGTDHEHT